MGTKVREANWTINSSEYYIVSAYDDNYLHLTGLHISLSDSDFLKSAIQELWKIVILTFVEEDRMKMK